MKKKLTALFLAVVMCITPCLTSFAMAIDMGNLAHTGSLTIGDTKIDSYKSSNGDAILLQYVDGVLTHRNTIKATTGEIITEIFCNGTVQTGSISATDYVTAIKSAVSLIPVNLTNTNSGIINYRALYNANYIYYSAECTYTIGKSGPTTYEFGGFMGALIDFASLLVSCLAIPEELALNVAKNLLANAGISVVSGMLSDAFTGTVSCEKTPYTWTLVDEANSKNKAYLEGVKYYITDIESNKRGETYYEGYVPEVDWETDSFAGAVHSELFDYLMWEVIGWNEFVHV